MSEEQKKAEEALDLMTDIRVIVKDMAETHMEMSKLMPNLGFPSSGEEFVKSRVEMWRLTADFVEKLKKLNDLI